MSIEHDAILLENFRGSIAGYERSVLGAMTASAAFFLISFRLDSTSSVEVLYGELPAVAAWGIALAFFFLLGAYARSAITRAEEALCGLKLADTLRHDIARSFSLATADPFYRVSSVLFCPATVLLAFVLRLYVEVGRGAKLSGFGVLALIVFILVVIVQYLLLAKQLWRPFGSRSNQMDAPDRNNSQGRS